MVLYDNSKVTVELREIVESGVNIWDFDYPSFYEGEEKKAFEQKVIDHYYFRQIGQETPGRWLHYFRTRIREIMPYYIQLYESEKFMKEIEDPFATVDYTETFEQETTGTSSGNSSSEGTNTKTSSGSSEKTVNEDRVRKFSNTPQGSIDNIENYMTEATLEDNTVSDTELLTEEGSETLRSSGTTGTSSEGKTTYTMTKKGAMGVTTFGHDMMEYRQSFLNIDKMVINELNDLFLLVY